MCKGQSFVSRCLATGIAAAAVSIFVLPTPASAWGANAERLVSNKAVDTLPPEIRGYFEANRDWLSRHVTEPLDWLQKNNQTERRNHFLYLDRYGKFPFDALPRDYKAAVTKFTRTKLESSGVLPWQIGVYSQKLTAAFRDHDWEQARLSAAYLAAYIAQEHDPFHTTENFDGHLSAQSGVDLRFGSSLVDRFSLFFPMRPNDAMYLRDPPTTLSMHACPRTPGWKISCFRIAAPAKDSLITLMSITTGFIT